MEKREPSYTIEGNRSWCSHYGEQYGGFLKNLKIEPPYDSTIPHLSKYLEKMKTLIQKYPCTSVFKETLFAITKIWKQPKCPSTDDWFNCIYIYIYTHTMESY